MLIYSRASLSNQKKLLCVSKTLKNLMKCTKNDFGICEISALYKRHWEEFTLLHNYKNNESYQTHTMRNSCVKYSLYTWRHLVDITVITVISFVYIIWKQRARGVCWWFIWLILCKFGIILITFRNLHHSNVYGRCNSHTVQQEAVHANY